MALALPSSAAEVIYPESDGNPISDHTLQFEWITLIKGNLDILFADDPNVFVAGDLLWYPVEGEPKIRTAPDAMVVIGRPKGERGSYQQWKEDNIPPQVVFEIKSPGNRPSEMFGKHYFYEIHGVEEYYFYDPFSCDFTVWQRSSDGLNLAVIDIESPWTSPCLGIQFDYEPGKPLLIFQPDGEPFLSFVDLEQRRRRAEGERDAAERRADEAEQRLVQLADRLRALGADPNAV